MGHDPAIGVVVKFTLDSARCTMEPAQILCGLFEHTGRQFTLAFL
jgi:hypothetical protein